jgi:hypothetical protein
MIEGVTKSATRYAINFGKRMQFLQKNNNYAMVCTKDFVGK